MDPPKNEPLRLEIPVPWAQNPITVTANNVVGVAIAAAAAVTIIAILLR